MDSGKLRPLVLIHQKTRQRYPLQGDFVIGRSTGNLVFDHDPKLSGKHCLIRAGESGFAIYDLKSRTGILINGAPLPQGKACVLKVGAQFTVGDQCFEIEQDRRAGERRPGIFGFTGRMHPLYASLAAALFVIAGLAMVFPPNSRAIPPNPGVAVTSSMQSIQGEMDEAMQRYQTLGDAIRNHTLDDRQSLALIRQDLIPRFAHVSSEFETYRPPNPKDFGRVDLQRRLAGAFFGQLTAMGNYIETKEPRYSNELSDFNRQMQSLTDEMHQKNGGGNRQPASD